ncbi:MAG: hypothetical protein RLZZ408_699 [Verrucomicrobiota bacterium]|jgi:hypothetical protein
MILLKSGGLKSLIHQSLANAISHLLPLMLNAKVVHQPAGLRLSRQICDQ